MTDKSIDDYLKKVTQKGTTSNPTQPILSSKPVLEDTTHGILNVRHELSERAPRKLDNQEGVEE